MAGFWFSRRHRQPERRRECVPAGKEWCGNFGNGGGHNWKYGKEHKNENLNKNESFGFGVFGGVISVNAA